MKSALMKTFLLLILPTAILSGFILWTSEDVGFTQFEKWHEHMRIMDYRFGTYVKGGYNQIDDEGYILKFKKMYTRKGFPVGLMYLDESTGFAVLVVSRKIPGNVNRFEDERFHRARYHLNGQVSIITSACKNSAHLYQTMDDGERYRVYHVVLAAGNMVYGTCPNRSESIIGVFFDIGGKLYGDTGLLRRRFYR